MSDRIILESKSNKIGHGKLEDGSSNGFRR